MGSRRLPRRSAAVARSKKRRPRSILGPARRPPRRREGALTQRPPRAPGVLGPARRPPRRRAGALALGCPRRLRHRPTGTGVSWTRPGPPHASASNGTTSAARRRREGGATGCRRKPAAAAVRSVGTAPPFWAPSHGRPDNMGPQIEQTKAAARSSGGVEPADTAVAATASDPAGPRLLPGTTVWQNVWYRPNGEDTFSFFR
ncbi:unnamed protein product [Urochloa humidicola]